MTLLTGNVIPFVDEVLVAPLGGRTAGLGVPNNAFTRRFFGVEANQDQRDVADVYIDNTPTAGPGATPQVLVGNVYSDLGLDTGRDWFEKVHIYPESLADNPGYSQTAKVEFGSILAQTDREFLLYSAYTRTPVTINSITNNTTPGTELPNITPPVTLQPQTALTRAGSTFNTGLLTGLGVQLRELVRALLEGLATFDDNIIFVFSSPDRPELLLSGSRISIFLPRPEMPFAEILEFGEAIVETDDGGEQRISTRLLDREIYVFNYRVHDRQRQNLHTFLFDRQDLVNGLPLWHEEVALSANVSAGAGSISIYGGDDSDFRVDGLAVLYTDDDDYEIVTISSVSDTSIGLKSVTVGAFDAIDTVLIPLRTALITNIPNGSRARRVLEAVRLQWTVYDLDNQPPASSTAWNSATIGTEPFLDECHYMEGDDTETSLQKKVVVIDNDTGLISQGSTWLKNKQFRSKGFLAKSKSRIKDLRAFIRWARGPQRSFWVSTKINDLTPSADLGNASPIMDIVFIDYRKFVGAREPKKTFKITYTDGTSEVKVIASAAAHPTDSTQERLTLTTTWSGDHTLAEIDRVEFCENVRFDTPSFRFLHRRPGFAKLTAPLSVVFDSD